MARAEIDLDGGSQATRASHISRRMLSPSEQVFRAKFPERAEQLISSALARITAQTNSFRGTFIIAPRGGGKSQAMFELAIRILDTDTEKVILPIFVQCSNWNWNQDMADILALAEKNAKESLIQLLEDIQQPEEWHQWPTERAKLERLCKALQSRDLSKLKEKSFSELVHGLDESVQLVLMFEDFDKQNSTQRLGGRPYLNLPIPSKK